MTGAARRAGATPTLHPFRGARYELVVTRPTLSVHGSIAEIPAAEWDALFAHEPDEASPFAASMRESR